MTPVMAGVISSTVGSVAAAADPTSSCTSSVGVLVIVDFRGFPPGDIERGCDATPTTGYDALNAAGFTTEGTQRDGPAFICRIDGYPTASNDACAVTPPSSRSWSYWHANAGDTTWSYSRLGATAYQPQPGSIDLWTFASTDIDSATSKPNFTPASVRPATATSPTATPTSSVTNSQPPSAPAPVTSSAPMAHASSTRKASPGLASASRSPRASYSSTPPPTASTTRSEVPSSSGVSSPGPRATATSSDASPSPTESTSALAGPSPGESSSPAAAIVDVGQMPVAQRSTISRGSPWALVIGLAIAAALAATTMLLSRRRRVASASRGG